ncbi:hypothetical protein HPB51_006600 [Rhipicephalus microplus]|uniref:F-box domain-containing protein n=1 Tax=Rhipicephalus microplus TaxID=6941 RepID=A0A9J6E7R8_RHIMP|nr:hypothetical protein HPB51_006600 [Rhipicephalus microplus]
MDVLPNEVLLPILALVDGASLVRCKRVCKRWLALVEAILQHRHVIWKMICQSEIDRDMLLELLGNSYPEDESGAVEMDWFSVYKCWYSTRVVSEFPHHIRKLKSFKGLVTCLKTSVSLNVFRRSPHDHSSCCSCVDSAVTPLSEVKEATESAAARICNDRLAALSLYRCVLSLMRLTLTAGGVEFHPLLRAFLQERFCSWIGLNEHCVFHVGSYWKAGKMCITSCVRETWKLAPVDREEPLYITLALVQRQGILVIATVDMGLYISVDAGRHVSEIKAARQWNGRVTALALRGSLLAIGLCSGWLCVYRVRDSLVDMEYRQPDWSRQLYEDPVIAVDVTSEPDTKQPTVVAATRQEVHVVTWLFGSV